MMNLYGKGETTIDNIRNSLMNNQQEVVIIADEDEVLVGLIILSMPKMDNEYTKGMFDSLLIHRFQFDN